MRRVKNYFNRFGGTGISLLLHVVLIGIMVKFMVGKQIEQKDYNDPVTVLIPPETIELTPKIDDKFPDDHEPMDPFVEPIPTSPTIDPTAKIEDPFEVPNLGEMPTEGLIISENSPISLQIPVRSGVSEKDRLNALKRSNAEYKKTELAVDRVLAWLVENQNNDGSWPKGFENEGQHRYAMTSLGMLCFLARGVTPDTEIYGDALTKAMLWIVDSVDLETGLIKSGVHLGNSFAYENAITCYALSESAGLVSNGAIKEAMNAMVKKIVASQRDDGSWAYRYALDSGHSDASLAGWHVQALKAAANAGCKVEGLKECLNKSAEMFMNAIQDDGAAFYKPDEKASKKLSIGAVAGLCLQLMGEGKHSSVKKAIRRVTKEFRNKDKQSSLFKWNSDAVTARKADWNVIVYDWYYQTQLVFKSGNRSLWKEWNRELIVNELLNAQVVKAGKHSDVAYWNWPGDKEDRTGWRQMYATCLNCLTLEVYYRHLPSLKKSKDKSVDTALFGDVGDLDI